MPSNQPMSDTCKCSVNNCWKNEWLTAVPVSQHLRIGYSAGPLGDQRTPAMNLFKANSKAEGPNCAAQFNQVLHNSCHVMNTYSVCIPEPNTVLCCLTDCPTSKRGWQWMPVFQRRSLGVQAPKDLPHLCWVQNSCSKADGSVLPLKPETASPPPLDARVVVPTLLVLAVTPRRWTSPMLQLKWRNNFILLFLTSCKNLPSVHPSRVPAPPPAHRVSGLSSSQDAYAPQ